MLKKKTQDTNKVSLLSKYMQPKCVSNEYLHNTAGISLALLRFRVLALKTCCIQIHAKTLAFRTPGAKLVAVSDIFEDAGARVVEGCNGVPKFYKVCVARVWSILIRSSLMI